MNEKYTKTYEVLEKEKQEVSWDALNDHHKREAVFLVSPELDLTDVATKIAIDDVEAIRTWMKDALLKKPSGDEILEFQNDDELSFNFIIVQPYILVQELIDLGLD